MNERDAIGAVALLLAGVLMMCGCTSWRAPVRPPAYALFSRVRAPLTVDVQGRPSGWAHGQWRAFRRPNRPVKGAAKEKGAPQRGESARTEASASPAALPMRQPVSAETSDPSAGICANLPFLSRYGYGARSLPSSPLVCRNPRTSESIRVWFFRRFSRPGPSNPSCEPLTAACIRLYCILWRSTHRATKRSEGPLSASVTLSVQMGWSSPLTKQNPLEATDGHVRGSIPPERTGWGRGRRPAVRP